MNRITKNTDYSPPIFTIFRYLLRTQLYYIVLMLVVIYPCLSSSSTEVQTTLNTQQERLDILESLVKSLQEELQETKETLHTVVATVSILTIHMDKFLFQSLYDLLTLQWQGSLLVATGVSVNISPTLGESGTN